MSEKRPQPGPDGLMEFEPREGYRTEWVVDQSWRMATEVERRERKCRRPGCRRTVVAFLARPRWSSGRGGPGYTWWAYCDWHLYGRKIEGGQVLSHRRIPNEEPPA